MKSGRIALVGTVTILFIVTFLFINNYSFKGNESENQSIVNSNEMENFLYGDSGIMNQVHNELSKKRLCIPDYDCCLFKGGYSDGN